MLLAEAAQAFYLLGFESQAQQYLDGLVDIGSRLADAYYFLAQFAVLDNRIAPAIDLFTTGWQLQPMERADVFANPLLAYLLDDITMREHLEVGNPAEPVPPCRFRRAKPLAVPEGTPSRVLGSLLVVDLAQGELWVPGGCQLASASAAVYDGRSWRRREETLVISRIDELATVLRSTGALTQPRIRRDLERATQALARRGKWQELVDLTQGIESDTNRLPSQLVRLRAAALQQLDRIDEARALLIRLAKGNMGKRRVDSGTLLQLADLLIAQEEFDLALKLVAKADAETPQPIGYDLVQQIRLQKSLAEAYTLYRTEHFEIRYPRTKNAYLAEAMGKILESERRRLQRWIPMESNEVTQVHLLPWNDFQATWSGGVDLLGLFDGDIRLPFADIVGFAPELVAIVTHELAHAMLAERTSNQAPHWFQEGLAQHVQMVQSRTEPHQPDRELLSDQAPAGLSTGGQRPGQHGGTRARYRRLRRGHVGNALPGDGARPRGHPRSGAGI
jgi:tetratricopeptide (TPR) repeat protein